MVIDKFNGEYYFLSNFYPSPITYNTYTYRNAEAAFQAQKDPKKAIYFTDLPPRKARELGRDSNLIKLRPDWEQVKDQIMYDIVKTKFTQNKWMIKLLIATGDATLIEGNTWRDQYWGVYHGKGLNRLGEILMQLRAEFADEKRFK